MRIIYIVLMFVSIVSCSNGETYISGRVAGYDAASVLSVEVACWRYSFKSWDSKKTLSKLKVNEKGYFYHTCMRAEAVDVIIKYDSASVSRSLTVDGNKADFGVIRL
jgi:hypothetical protein